jgi:hypothetical protein
VRNLLLIFLASVHLLGNTELGELLKLNQLIGHYYRHLKENAGISFISFISMHYITGDDGTNTDNEEDQKLPCHNLHQDHSFSGSFTFSFNPVEIEPPFTFNSTDYSKEVRNGFSSEHVLLFLQPPKA